MHGMNLFILVVSTWRLLMNHQYFTMMLNCNYCLTLDRAQSLISKIYLQTINYKLRQSESLWKQPWWNCTLLELEETTLIIRGLRGIISLLLWHGITFSIHFNAIGVARVQCLFSIQSKFVHFYLWMGFFTKHIFFCTFSLFPLTLGIEANIGSELFNITSKLQLFYPFISCEICCCLWLSWV